MKYITDKLAVLCVRGDEPFANFGKFIETRKRLRLSIRDLEHCIACKKAFDDDDGIYFACITGKGNRFMCKHCAYIYNTNGVYENEE